MGLIVPPHIAFDTPREGAPGAVGSAPEPKFFAEINNELADKGFLVTTTDDLINWART
ncbi:MAG: NADH-quinone oxidoreductase subunit B, partial [Hyphomicrobiaceae bacterium]|nr:NADH-quinone oxidoreductase subunit B [Hyphomicrobiaceae bacterium]